MVGQQNDYKNYYSYEMEHDFAVMDAVDELY